MPSDYQEKVWLKHNPFIFFHIVFFVLMSAFWAFINAQGLVDTNLNYLFGLLLAVMPFLGFLVGLKVAKQWGGFKSQIGKSITFVSVGLLCWSLGTVIFAYYNLVGGIEVPYPSFADVLYVLIYLFYFLGTIYFLKLIAIPTSYKTIKGKLFLTATPVLIAIISFQYLIGGELQLGSMNAEALLDIFYPLGDSVLLSVTILAIILSLKYLGGRYRIPLYVLFVGFVFEYLADFSFSITTSNETFFVASWVDLLFLISTFTVGASLAMFKFHPSSINRSKNGAR